MSGTAAMEDSHGWGLELHLVQQHVRPHTVGAGSDGWVRDCRITLEFTGGQ